MGDLPEARNPLTGTGTFIFDNTDLLDKARSRIASSIEIELGSGTKDGTLGNEKITVTIDPIKWDLATAPVEGEGGASITLPFTAYDDGGAQDWINIVIDNTVATYLTV